MTMHFKEDLQRFLEYVDVTVGDCQALAEADYTSWPKLEGVFAGARDDCFWDERKHQDEVFQLKKLIEKGVGEATAASVLKEVYRRHASRAAGSSSGGARPGAAIPHGPTAVPAGEFGEFENNVARLKLNGATIGSGCLVTFKDKLLFVTARHCLDPVPGSRIDTSGLTAYGLQLRHYASYPHHDISVLQLEDGSLLPKKVTPFELVSGTKTFLYHGKAITMAGFPLATNVSVPAGIRESDMPIMTRGTVSWISSSSELAIGDYNGALPNSSGAAVAASATELAGVHLGIARHEAGQRPLDSTAARDQRVAEPASMACGGGGAAAAGLVVVGFDVVEVDTWSTSDVEGVGLREVCGRTKRIRRGAEAEAEGGSSSELNLAKVEYCVDNVAHKGCRLGYFVPSHALDTLLVKSERHLLQQRGC